MSCVESGVLFMQMMANLTNAIRLQELHLMSSFQSYFSHLETLFKFGCHLGDPQNSYVLFFTAALIYLSNSSAFTILWTAALSEWFNTIFKWMFNDHRPYWWTHLIGQSVRLKQFDITCETGPGFPSGHVMVTSSVWFVLICQMIKCNVIRSEAQKWLCFAICLLLLSIIACGRVYISAHFPDQCVFALVFGLSLALFTDQVIHINKIKLRHHFVVSFAIIIISYICHELMNRIGGDADWSLKLAHKWCFDVKYVKADTTPLYVVWRSSGAILGIGLAFHLIVNLLKKNKRFSWIAVNSQRLKVSSKSKLMNAILSLMFVTLYMSQTKPNTELNADIYNFYLKSYFQFAFLPIFGVIFVSVTNFLLKEFM